MMVMVMNDGAPRSTFGDGVADSSPTVKVLLLSRASSSTIITDTHSIALEFVPAEKVTIKGSVGM